MLQRRPSVQATQQRQVQRRLGHDQVSQLVAEYEAGASMHELSDRWRLHRTTVASHLRSVGIPLRRQGVPAEALDEATQLYANGWSCRMLAEHYECDNETVRQALRRAGVKLRAPWDRH